MQRRLGLLQVLMHLRQRMPDAERRIRIVRMRRKQRFQRGNLVVRLSLPGDLDDGRQSARVFRVSRGAGPVGRPRGVHLAHKLQRGAIIVLVVRIAWLSLGRPRIEGQGLAVQPRAAQHHADRVQRERILRQQGARAPRRVHRFGSPRQRDQAPRPLGMGAGMVRCPLERGAEQLFGPGEIRVVTGQQAEQIERLGIVRRRLQHLDTQRVRFPVGLP